MAPSVDVSSLVGTWLGTMFTGFGLLAVLTQLNNIIKTVIVDRRRWKEKAAGQWASCIQFDHVPNNGVVESAVPNFSGWLQRCYLEDRQLTTTQDDRGTSGKSSWSKVFGRLDIKACDLVDFGGARPELYPALVRDKAPDAKVRLLRPGLADMLVENESVSYGFSAAEFAALLILCGFPPQDFRPTPSGFRCSVWYFGRMLLDNHGPFSQVAQFDTHHNFRDLRIGEKAALCDVPVAPCLQLAFGMIRTPGRRNRDFIIITDSPPCLADPIPIEFEVIKLWSAYPRSQQIRNIQYAFERFIGVGEVCYADFEARHDQRDQEDVVLLKGMIGNSTPHLNVFAPVDTEAKYAILARGILAVAYAIASLEPWALLPVLPTQTATAFKEILSSFYKPKEYTVEVLQRELLSARCRHSYSEALHGRGLSYDGIQELLGLIHGDRDLFFRGSGASAVYHEAMCRVFRYHMISIANVRNILAAAATSRILWPDGPSKRSTTFEANLRNLLDHSTKRSVPDWAVDVYANYLWGWITCYVPADPDIIDHFRRRVFLA